MADKTTKPKLSPESKKKVKEAAKRTNLRKGIMPPPRADEIVERQYLVKIQTRAHRPDQLIRLDKTLRRELHHAFGSELAEVFRLDYLENNSMGNPDMVKLHYDPKEKL